MTSGKSALRRSLVSKCLLMVARKLSAVSAFSFAIMMEMFGLAHAIWMALATVPIEVFPVPRGVSSFWSGASSRSGTPVFRCRNLQNKAWVSGESQGIEPKPKTFELK